MPFDDIFNTLGEFGRYQKRVYLLQCLPQIFSAIQTCLSVFILFPPDHRCYLPGYHNDTYSIQNDYHETLINRSIPFEHIKDDYGITTTRYSQCQLYNDEFTNKNGYQVENGKNRTWYVNEYYQLNSTVLKYECNEWVYDKTEFVNTFVTQDNLVCRRKSLRIHAMMSFMAGFTFGSLVLGIFSDMKGRKNALLASIVLYLVSNIGVSLTTDFTVFVTLRFLSGMSVGGLLGTGFVMGLYVRSTAKVIYGREKLRKKEKPGLEYVGPTKRMWAGIVIELFWASGMLLLALLAYFIRDWKYLNLVVSIPPVFFLSYIWIMPESVRWLLVKGRKDEAIKITRRASIVNKSEPCDKIIEKESFEAETCVPLWKLFSTPRMALQSFIIFFNWMMCSMLFYGLSFNVGNISGNIFLNFFLVSLAEIVGFSGCLLVLNRFGRKPVYVTSSILAGVFCICTIFPALYGTSDLQWVTMTLASIGKVFASASFATVLLYTAELFPTVIRNSAMGTAAFFARVGGMIAPYIVDLAQTVEGDVGRSLPMTIFGLTAILAGFFAWRLPETVNRFLPETFADAMQFTQKAEKWEVGEIDADVEIDVGNETTKLRSTEDIPVAV